MTIATLSDIITKVRRLTGTGNSSQLTNNQIIDYINSFYLYDFPAELRTLNLKNTFTINTIQNVDTYPFDLEHYDSVGSPAYINKKLVAVYTSPWPFYSQFFNWMHSETLDTGDGTAGPYSGTLASAPIIKSYNNKPIADTQQNPTTSFDAGYTPTFAEPNPNRAQNILITANTATGTLNVTDDGNGNFIGNVETGSPGTIDYETGVITGLNFSAVIPSGNTITISYNASRQSMPQAILYWQNQIILRPVPDKGYLVEIAAYRRPSQVLLGSTSDGAVPDNAGVPELLEWWETLAAGAAKKIFEDRQDEDGIEMMNRMLMERYALNETRVYAQLGSSRVATIFSDQLNGAGGNYFNWGNGNG